MLAATVLFLTLRAKDPPLREQFRQTNFFRKQYLRWDQNGSARNIVAPNWHSPLPAYLRHNAAVAQEVAKAKTETKLWQRTKMTDSLAFQGNYLVTVMYSEEYAKPGRKPMPGKIISWGSD